MVWAVQGFKIIEIWILLVGPSVLPHNPRASCCFLKDPVITLPALHCLLVNLGVCNLSANRLPSLIHVIVAYFVAIKAT